DEANHSMEVIVPEDQLSLAIGKRGQNVRLAAQLTGWRLDIKSEAKLEQEMSGVKQLMAAIEGLGPMRAGILVNEGVTTPDELVALGGRSLERMLNLEAEEADKIIENAKAFDKQAYLESQLNQSVSDSEKLELLANASAAPTTEKVEVAEEK